MGFVVVLWLINRIFDTCYIMKKKNKETDWKIILYKFDGNKLRVNHVVLKENIKNSWVEIISIKKIEIPKFDWYLTGQNQPMTVN